jgi:hypothetical protein
MCGLIMARTDEPISEAREFARFLKSFWGLWAGLSATIFPLSNVLYATVPVPDSLKPLYVTFSTVCSLFAIAMVFVSRRQLWERHRGFSKPAGFADNPQWLRWFGGTINGLALLAFIFFIISAQSYLSDFAQATADFSFALTIGLLYYTLTFMLLTTAFSLLAIHEFMARVR